MIAVDTSSLIAYLAGDSGPDTDLVDHLLLDRQALLPPVVLTELFSDPKLPKELRETIQALPVLELSDGYWERAGRNRARLLQRRVKARLADSLVAQSCIDHNLALITRDKDFRHFVRLCGLRLA